MAKRPVSAIGNKRPITEYARIAAAMGGHPRFKVSKYFSWYCSSMIVQVENINEFEGW